MKIKFTIVFMAVCGTIGLFGAGNAIAADSIVAKDYAKAAKQGRHTLQELMDEQSIPGMSVAVFVDGEAVWLEGLGHADLEKKQPITPSTRFRLGSVSKVLAAATVGRLVDTGKLDLDAPIQRYVPGMPSDGGKDAITTRLLSGHLAGVRHYGTRERTEPFKIDRRNFATTEEALTIFKDDPLTNAPGQTYQYSTYGYTLMSAAVEGASGSTYLDYLQTQVLDPLGMSNTTADYSDRDVSNKTGFFNRTRRTVEARPVDSSYKWAGGGILSTAEDVARFGHAHISEGFLSSATRDVLFTSQTLPDGTETGIGIGWRIGRDATNRLRYHHAGSMTGCRAFVAAYPESKVVIAVLSNLTATPLDIEALGATLADPFHAAR